MELLLEWQNQHKKCKKLGEQLKNLFRRTIFWCSIAEKIFWSDILQEKKNPGWESNPGHLFGYHTTRPSRFLQILSIQFQWTKIRLLISYTCRYITRNCSGQGTFLEVRALWYTFPQNIKDERSRSRKFWSFLS